MTINDRLEEKIKIAIELKTKDPNVSRRYFENAISFHGDDVWIIGKLNNFWDFIEESPTDIKKAVYSDTNSSEMDEGVYLREHMFEIYLMSILWCTLLPSREKFLSEDRLNLIYNAMCKKLDESEFQEEYPNICKFLDEIQITINEKEGSEKFMMYLQMFYRIFDEKIEQFLDSQDMESTD